MNIHLELAKMVCMGWRSEVPTKTKELLEAYLSGYTLNSAEKHLLCCAISALDLQQTINLTQIDSSLIVQSHFLPKNIVPPNNVSEPVKKRRGCPPGGWPKKDKPPEHD